jgi:hypothetical protein
MAQFGLAETRRWLRQAGNGLDPLTEDSIASATTTLINPSLPTSAAQPWPLPILLPAGIRQACHHRSAIAPMHYRVIMAADCRREATVAAVGTLHKGFSIEYAWAQVGSAANRRQAGACYIGAAEGGEPPGHWWGPGARALGFRNGQEIERKPYDLVFGQRVHPLDGTRLGRRRQAADKAAEAAYARLLQAEPHATAQRKRELRDAAAREARQSPRVGGAVARVGAT